LKIDAAPAADVLRRLADQRGGDSRARMAGVGASFLFLQRDFARFTGSWLIGGLYSKLPQGHGSAAHLNSGMADFYLLCKSSGTDLRGTNHRAKPTGAGKSTGGISQADFPKK